MKTTDGVPAAIESIGVAGRCANEQEKAYVKQAVFLLRYRMKFLSQQRQAGEHADKPDAPQR